MDWTEETVFDEEGEAEEDSSTPPVLDRVIPQMVNTSILLPDGNLVNEIPASLGDNYASPSSFATASAEESAIHNDHAKRTSNFFHKNEQRFERPSKLHALDGDMNVYQDVTYDDVSL